MDVLTEKFLIVAQKLQGNKYLSAVRDGFLFALPLTLTASFCILFNNVIFAKNLPYGFANPEYYNNDLIEKVNVLKFMLTQMEFGTLQWITPFVLMGIAYSFSQHEKAERPFVNAIIIFSCFITMLPKEELITNSKLFEGANLFTALLVGFLFTKFLLKLQTIDQLKIKLPDQVPPMVSKSFSTLIPALIAISLAGMIATFFMYVAPFGFTNLSTFISGIVQEPFLALARTGLGGSVIFLSFVIGAHVLWIFGLHGTSILSGFAEVTLGVLAINNQTIYAATGDAFHPELATFTIGFFAAYVRFGGSGATMGLILAIWIASKREDYKAIAKLSIAPGIFEINEPLTFGLPIVLNPVLAIPFVLAPLVSTIIPGILTSFGVLPKIVIAIPWVTPPILSAFIGTAGNWLSVVVSIINLILITLVYLPFVIMSNKAVEQHIKVEN